MKINFLWFNRVLLSNPIILSGYNRGQIGKMEKRGKFKKVKRKSQKSHPKVTTFGSDSFFQKSPNHRKLLELSTQSFQEINNHYISKKCSPWCALHVHVVSRKNIFSPTNPTSSLLVIFGRFFFYNLIVFFSQIRPFWVVITGVKSVRWVSNDLSKFGPKRERKKD